MIVTIQLMNTSNTACGHNFIGKIREIPFTNLSMALWLAEVSCCTVDLHRFFILNKWNSGLFNPPSNHSTLCSSELHIFRCPIYIRKIMGHLSFWVALFSSMFIYLLRIKVFPFFWGSGSRLNNISLYMCGYACASTRILKLSIILSLDERKQQQRDFFSVS